MENINAQKLVVVVAGVLKKANWDGKRKKTNGHEARRQGFGYAGSARDACSG
jgi:hypothetical protein